jgi:signal transduction histidine kinase
MEQQSKNPTASQSVLQHTFSLGELLDLDSFREVCASFADLFKIGFKIFDQSLEMLVDVKGSSQDYCSYLYGFSSTKIECTKHVSAIREQPVSNNQIMQHDCFTGLRYLIAPICHEGDVMGKVVFGPYFPSGGTPGQLQEVGARYSAESASRLFKQVRSAQDDVVYKIVKNLVQSIEVILYIGYKNTLTTRMHVEAVSASYTELQNKNQELRESYQRLKELDRLKSNFLATVSHELRTPLTSVIGYSEMLLEGLAGELQGEQKEYVGTIMEKGEQLLSLISGLLDFSKIESGNLRLNLGKINIIETIQTSISTVLPLARKMDVNIDFSAGEKIPSIDADGEKIRQVLVNILGNAVKFNRLGGNVKVATQVVEKQSQVEDENMPFAVLPEKEEWLRIDISDTGIGIPQDKLARIFDSFFQVDGSSTREFGGTGLGLAIARSMVDGHGGQIEVESEEGKGTTFTVFLPLVTPE